MAEHGTLAAAVYLNSNPIQPEIPTPRNTSAPQLIGASNNDEGEWAVQPTPQEVFVRRRSAGYCVSLSCVRLMAMVRKASRNWSPSSALK
jgi:hypothetical protein